MTCCHDIEGGECVGFKLGRKMHHKWMWRNENADVDNSTCRIESDGGKKCALILVNSEQQIDGMVEILGVLSSTMVLSVMMKE